MKLTQKIPCVQCPYTCNLPGYIGDHESPKDFEDVVRADLPFPCHMSAQSVNEDCHESILEKSKSQHCVGYILYMNRMAKLSRRTDVAKRQQELSGSNDLVVNPWSGELISIHQDAIDKMNRGITMKKKKYELTNTSKIVNGIKVYQIKALISFGNVVVDDLGGYVQSEKNLSHSGECWVYSNAIVCSNATVSQNALVYGSAQIHDNAQISGSAKIYEYAIIYGHAKVYGMSEVYGEARVYHFTRVYDRAKIYGYAKIYENGEVFNNVEICRTTEVIKPLKN